MRILKASAMLLLALCSTAWAAGTEVSGLVKDAKGKAVSGVTVLLVDTATRLRLQQTSDNVGRFRFESVSAGKYRLVAFRQGHNPFMQEIQVADKPLTDIPIALTLQKGDGLRVTGPGSAQPGPVLQRPAAAGQAGQSPSNPATRDASTEPFRELSFNPTEAGSPTADIPGAAQNPEDEQTLMVRGAQQNPFGGLNNLDDRGIEFLRDMMGAQFEGGMARMGGSGGNFNFDFVQGGNIMFNSGGMPRMAGMGGGPQGGEGGGPIVIMRMEGPGQRGGGGAGGGGGRGRIGRSRANRIQGNANVNLFSSLLNARPYSLSGTEQSKKDYTQTRFGLSLGGPLTFLSKDKTNPNASVFVQYNGGRGSELFSQFSTVPTAAERNGDFSATRYASGPLAGRPVRLFDSLSGSGAEFANAVIPSARFDPIARSLLSYIPLPNLPGTVNNYYEQRALRNSSDSVSARLSYALDGRQQIGLSYGMNRSDGIGGNRFPGLLSERDNLGQNLSLNYTLSVRRGFVQNLSARINRNRAQQDNTFSFKQDIAGQLGIQGVSREPLNYGIPTIGLTNFGDLSDSNASRRVNLSWSIADSVNYVRKKHSLRVGFDYNRNINNSLSDPNGRGTFTFSGFATGGVDAQGRPVPGTGFDLADFLLGLPQTTVIRFGQPDVYLRSQGFSAHVDDNWRWRPSLTIQAGLRYQLATPAYEKYNRLVNLDIAPDFRQVVPVLAGGQAPYSGDLPRALIRTDRNNWAPRVSLAWKPPLGRRRQAVVRAGYSVFYSDEIYSRLTSNLVGQPPFATTQRLLTDRDQVLTLRNGFPPDLENPIKNSYAVDPNYVVGYVQQWNLNVQHPLPANTVVTIGYLGTKGTKLDLLRAPNQRDKIPGAQEFVYESPGASSILHALQISANRRFTRNASLFFNYTFGKSIDNASSIAGSAAQLVQNDEDLRSERGLSFFDVRHRANLVWRYELPFGEQKRWLKSPGLGRQMLGGWSLSGNVNASSGTPYTPRVLGNQLNNSGSGTFESDRASVTGRPVALPRSERTTTRFFDTSAFRLPDPGSFGNAGRNTIIGPGTWTINANLNRTIRVGGEGQRLMMMANASNVLNHPNFTGLGTVVNSLNFGRVLSTRQMRQVRMDFRYFF
ncbi:MAG: carboxypeptidase regulatory-like domain-containing protein [Acidobacteriota bacterium]